MNEPNPQTPQSGWTFPRVVGFVLALFAMVSFGVCSLIGIGIGGGEAGVLALVALGIALTVGSVFWLRAILRRVRQQ